MKNTFRRTKMKTQQIQSYWVQVRQYFVAQNVSIKKKETSQGIQKLVTADIIFDLRETKMITYYYFE